MVESFHQILAMMEASAIDQTHWIVHTLSAWVHTLLLDVVEEYIIHLLNSAEHLSMR